MTDEQKYEAKMEQWISEAYTALSVTSPENLSQLHEETIDKAAEAVLGERMKAEYDRDPAFREYVIRKEAEYISTRCLEERRPIGSYRKDGLLPLGNGKWIQMPLAKREHLLALVYNRARSSQPPIHCQSACRLGQASNVSGLREGFKGGAIMNAQQIHGPLVVELAVDLNASEITAYREAISRSASQEDWERSAIAFFAALRQRHSKYVVRQFAKGNAIL